MPRIVKLSELNKKDRKKIEEQTQKEVAERKENIQNEVSFVSKNETRLPVNNNRMNNIPPPVRTNRVQNYNTNNTFPITNNINRSNIGEIQKSTSQKVFETLNPGKKISYKNEQPNLRNKADLIRNILTTGTSISKGENAGKLVNNILTTTQNLGTSAYTGLLQFGKVLNERLADNQNMRIKADNILTDNTKDKQKAKNLLKGQADLLGLNYNEEKNKIEELKYEDVNKKIQSKINEENNNTAKRIEESTGLGKTTAELASSLGNNLVGMVGSAANPGLGLTYFVGSATGSYEDDAKERGMEGNQAKLYSGIMGAFEGLGDYIFGYGAVNKGLSAVGKKSVGKAITSFGETLLGSGLENAFQEGITEPINELVATAVGGRDKADWQNIEQRILKSAGYGFLSGLIFDGIGRGAGSITNIQNKLNNGENISQADVKNVVKDLESTGMTREEILNNARNNAIESVKTEINRTNNQEQTKRDITERINNSNLSEEDKSNMLNYVQNEDFTQADYNAMRETIDNSQEQAKQEIISRTNNNQQSNNISQEQISSLVERIDKSNLPNEDKLMMKDYIQNNNVSQADIDSMNNVIDSAVSIPANNELVTNQNFKDNVEARKKYTKYKNDTGEYNSNAINEVLDLIPENRNGNRTVKQWLQVAKETGTRIADLSNEEIERIAYKSWFDVQPSKNITKYDRQSKSTVGFQKLTSDEWINEINKAVNEARNNQEQNENSNQSSFIMPTAENTKKEVNLPKAENNTQKTKGEPINWNEIERPEGKFRKHYQSIIQSSNTTAQAKAVARELMEADTYIPESNKNQLLRADERIQINGADKELTTLSTNVDNGSKITSVDIAVGERLIEYYSKIGNKAKLQEAIQTTAMAGTQAGQTVQALALLNHQTPQGQVTWIQRSVDKLNKELKHKKGDKAKQFEFTSEMQQKILNAKDKQEMNNVIDEVYQELGQQVPKSFTEKLDSWRYFSMLANPRTHIRNIVGNFAMGKMQEVKNKVAGAIEDTMSLVNKDMERTHTLKRASKETKQFAKNDLNNVDIQTRLELNENKYNPKSRIENSQRTFKIDALEKTIGKAFNFNDTALEAEDGFGLKHAYVKALSEYMTANKLTPETITEKQLAKARNHAIEEAKEATFHSKNAIATAINQFSRKNKLTKYTTDAILPFVKTPMNVAKAGLEYNPTGLIKTLTVDSVKLRKGNISVNKYIDNLSKGLTGTGLAVLGYAMAKAGILKASGGDDDKKEKYDEALGRQAYSLEINGKTFSLDWLAPAGIPLFVGAEAQNIKSQGEKEKKSISSDDDSKSKQIMESLENWANAMSNSISPMSEMSMISGLTSALKSYDNDSQKMLGTMATNSLKSYVNQFVPTALGQLARTTDEYERNTTSTKTGVLSKPIDQVKLQVMSKIPGLRQKLPTKSDIWGNEVKQQANIPFRAFNNFVNPSIIKDVSINEVDKELNSLYSKTRESSIIPKSIDKTFTIDGENYRMTNEEYAKYNKKYGETSYNLIKGLVTSNDYKNLTDEQKQKAIESVYSYAKEQNKVDYAKENNKEVKQSALYETMKALESKGGNQSNYLEFISKTSGADIKERQKVNTLYNADYDKNTKDIIYSNTIGKDDEIYNKVKKDNVSINSYLKYKDAVYNETDKKRNSGELEKEQNLKSVDKIKILLNSNFSENEKKSLYSNAIADDDVYSKLLKENINIDEYLNFKKAQLNEKLASDKDKYGQAIRGTSKEKFFKYINSKISGYENRLIIAGKNYKLSNKERQKLVNIINNNTEEGKERINMYKNFSRNFIVNGNNVFYK